ncbi:hypothetical protein ThrDRAFT_04145 [Frankia casuarinae]|uniref:O-antigen polymerase n=1 Tax=Frankia casuarinae (strain DSM 45818 / CECT 9043 / HFP020203 / CcI3) TaxID=106370 RepID=Q2JCU2_FRACC|nr:MULTISPECIES: hypothetical protein [Frankia]ABD10900.1 hypothetical protein Francci3_1524 [Frankia casuarinae]ETA02962.1 hypothetical protein CcI6DRAFT_01484 [Frankia sp. CcI6]EYT90235.1 hypothetical protein ThrDRAFT_04145 [Frankia casuarinae]KDA42772.1 hypothetical protein BMG523Draft_02322 [Frankia sp. BMG5.23]OFB38532.1 hypothetical protein Manayef4_04810 [Frankia sp. CgIM4]
MSATLALGLLLQGLALVVVVRGRGRHAVSSLGLMFVGAAIVYHGVTEVLQVLVPSYSDNRLLTTESDVAAYTVLVGFSLLAFAFGYRFATPRTPPSTGFRREEVLDFFDWRVLTPLALAAVAVTAVGRNTSPGHADPSTVTGSPYLVSGFATQFLVVGLALGSFAVLVRTKGRGFLPVLGVQCTLHTLAGQRLPVAIAAGAVIYLLSIVGIPIRRRQLVSVVALVVLAYVVIYGARADAGRQVFGYSVGPGQRLQALASGLTHLEGGINPGEVGDLGVRLDGNSYPSIILRRLRDGSPPIGPVTLWNDVNIAVPRFLNPDKLNSDLESRSLKTRLSDTYGITNAFDRLPTQLGELLPIGGPPWMVTLAALAGFVLVRLEYALRECRHPAALLGLLALVAAILQYEGGIALYTINGRGVLAIAAGLFVWRKRRIFRPATVRGLTTLPPLYTGTPATVARAGSDEDGTPTNPSQPGPSPGDPVRTEPASAGRDEAAAQVTACGHGPRRNR